MTTLLSHLLPVLGGTVASMIVGMIWYSKPVFGATWLHMTGKTEHSIKESALSPAQAISITLVCTFVASWTLLILFRLTGTAGLLPVARLTVILWAGLLVMVRAPHSLFEGRPGDLFAMYSIYDLASMLAMALAIDALS